MRDQTEYMRPQLSGDASKRAARIAGVTDLEVGQRVGGYGGARLARRIQARVLRIVVICVGQALSGYYFAI